MIEDDYLLDEDDDGGDLDSVIVDTADDDEDGGDPENDDLDSSSPVSSAIQKDESGRLTSREMKLSSLYNDTLIAVKRNQDSSVLGGRVWEGYISDALANLIAADPKNTSSFIRKKLASALFRTQAKNQIVGSVYQPERMRADDLDEKFGGIDDDGFNERLTKDLREQITRFIGYLASRDLSRDGTRARNFKVRHIPAFIIYMFSSGLYDFITHCPTMPEVYQNQIDNAMKRLNQGRVNLVEELASEYEKRGKQDIADMVRRRGVAWFSREPAELTYVPELRTLTFTPEDQLLHKEYRSKFLNTSKSITLDTISKMILVVLDHKGGIFEELKDKTRTEAIDQVKQLYKKWASENPIDSELANEIIWGTRLRQNKLKEDGSKS